MSPDPKGFTNNFDGVRLIGAMLVLFSHQFAVIGLPEPTMLGHSSGSFGVVTFFAISGYLVMESWRRDPNIFRFLTRRLLRIWPALAVVMLLGVFILGPIVSPLEPSDYFKSTDFIEYLPGLLFAFREGIFFPSQPYHALNGSLWTIQIEVGCYAILGVAGATMLLRSRLLVAIALVAGTAYFFYAILPAQGHTTGTARTLLFLTFLFGVTLSNYKQLLAGRWSAISVVFAVVVTVIAAKANQNDLAVSILVPILAINIGVRAWPLLKGAGRFGDLSYGIYLYAWPVQQTMVYLMGKDKPFLLHATMTVITTAALAYASWNLIEKRALRFKPLSRSTEQWKFEAEAMKSI